MILMADISGMDLLARACHEMYHERISKEVMAAQALVASAGIEASKGMAAGNTAGDGGAIGDRHARFDGDSRTVHLIYLVMKLKLFW
jgi:hypothetical protein